VPVVIREYEQDDLDECRRLYVQLVEHHRWIYDDPSIGGADPGAGFDSYLATPERVMTWVAVEGDRLVGMTGLFWEGEESTIEPVIVDHDSRTRGIGRRLVEAAIEESRRRGGPMSTSSRLLATSPPSVPSINSASRRWATSRCS
jgi:GNAT superfamily N-acetyltransferase